MLLSSPVLTCSVLSNQRFPLLENVPPPCRIWAALRLAYLPATHGTEDILHIYKFGISFFLTYHSLNFGSNVAGIGSAHSTVLWTLIHDWILSLTNQEKNQRKTREWDYKLVYIQEYISIYIYIYVHVLLSMLRNTGLRVCVCVSLHRPKFKARFYTRTAS